MVIRGDPTDLSEILALMFELNCHVVVGAGLPVAIHARLAEMPCVIDVDGCIESASFTIALPAKCKIVFSKMIKLLSYANNFQ